MSYIIRDGNGVPIPFVSSNIGDSDGTQITYSVPSNSYGIAYSDANPSSVANQARQVTLIERSAGLNASPVSIGISSVMILNSNPSRKGFWIQNLDLNNLLYINFGSTATTGPGSLVIPPLSIYETPIHMMPIVAIYAISSAAGTLYTCKEC